MYNYFSNHIFKDLNSEKLSPTEPQWLIYAENANGTAITSSQMTGFTQYAQLNSYIEDLKIVNKQYIGANGIMYSANLILFLPRSSICIEFFNQFSQKSVMTLVKLVEILMVSNVVNTSGQFVIRQNIEYKSCLVTNYKQHAKSTEIHISYASRSNTYYQYENGAKIGTIIGSNINQT